MSLQGQLLSRILPSGSALRPQKKNEAQSQSPGPLSLSTAEAAKDRPVLQALQSLCSLELDDAYFLELQGSVDGEERRGGGELPSPSSFTSGRVCLLVKQVPAPLHRWGRQHPGCCNGM